MVIARFEVPYLRTLTATFSLSAGILVALLEGPRVLSGTKPRGVTWDPRLRNPAVTVKRGGTMVERKRWTNGDAEAVRRSAAPPYRARANRLPRLRVSKCDVAGRNSAHGRLEFAL